MIWGIPHAADEKLELSCKENSAHALASIVSSTFTANAYLAVSYFIEHYCIRKPKLTTVVYIIILTCYPRANCAKRRSGRKPGARVTNSASAAKFQRPFLLFY